MRAWSPVGFAMKVTARSALRDKDGYLVYVCGTREGPFRRLLQRWDSWRIVYCTTHRHDNIDMDFVEGIFTIKSIYYTIKYKLNEVERWHKLKVKLRKDTPK